MRASKWRWMVLVAGLAMAGNALADGPQNAHEQKIIDQLKAAYQQRGLTLTPEQEEQVLQRMRRMEGAAIQAKVLNDANPDATPAQRMADTMAILHQEGGLPTAAGTPDPPVATPTMAAPAATAAPMTAAQVVAAIDQRHAEGGATVFVPQRDGFLADGKPVVDPLGQIDMFGGDAATGDVAYFVRQSPTELLVRYINVHSTLAPVTVGAIQLAPGVMRFTSSDGQQVVAGDNIIPAGTGVIVARDATVFSYPFGKALSTQPLPPTYHLAPYQRGDVAGTGYVLLRREISQGEKQDVVKNFTGLFKSITNHEDDKDFALFDVRNGNMVYLNMDEVGENVGSGTGCHAKNAFVNTCRGWETHEALYTDAGIPNYQHYYWRVDWRPTADGPTAVALEKGVANVDVIRLDANQRATAFHRGMGIERFADEPTADGSLKVTADWAFHSHVLADVRSLFAAGPAATAHAAPSVGAAQP